ncbi:MAG: beta-lactamase domain protein [Anaerocolumna sp.]|jgi:beta-lactamase superfamily II metal-dependent hydrolase|nr:beta-lactamase domain protein [Anaerocolumna sp.]
MNKFFKKFFCLFLVLLTIVPFSPQEVKAYDAPGLNAYYISVGKADCILLQQGALYSLVDTGDEAYLGEVLNFLRRKGVTTLEYLIITHLDPDHCGNVQTLCEEFTVKNLVYRSLPTTGYNNLNAGYQARYDSITSAAALNKITSCYDGQSLTFNGATIKFFNNPVSYLANSSYDSVALTTRVNLDSLIFQAIYQNTKFMFLADSGTASNDYVSNKYAESVLKSDVLKVAHHGMSANNTATLISKIDAKIAINSSSSAFAIEPLTVTRLTTAYSSVKIYETFKVSSYVATASQGLPYTGILVMSDGTNVTSYGVYDSGTSSCNKTAFVK